MPLNGVFGLPQQLLNVLCSGLSHAQVSKQVLVERVVHQHIRIAHPQDRVAQNNEKPSNQDKQPSP